MAGELGPLCSVEQYEAKYGPCDRLGELEATLMDATLLVLSELGGEPGTPRESAVALSVTRAAAHRAMLRPVEGISQMNQTAGSYSGQVTFSNPDGSCYLTRSERDLLCAEVPVLSTGRMVGRDSGSTD